MFHILTMMVMTQMYDYQNSMIKIQTYCMYFIICKFYHSFKKSRNSKNKNSNNNFLKSHWYTNEKGYN